MIAGASPTIVSTAQIGNGVIVDADINGAAAIAESKIAFATNDGSRHDHSAADIAVGTLITTRGGTGLSDPVAKGLLRAQGSSAMDLIAPGSAGQILKSDGTDWAAGSAPAGVSLVKVTQTNYTGGTGEQTLATLNLPANSLGANGFMRITCDWHAANDGGGAGTQTLKIKYGGTIFAQHSRSNTSGAGDQISVVNIHNANNASAQIGDDRHFANDGAAPSLKSVATSATGAINTTQAQDILITGQLGTAAHHIRVDRVSVEVFYKA